MITKFIRLKWNEMPGESCGMGTYDEDYSLLYMVIFPEGNRSAWPMLKMKIEELVKRYFEEDPDADRLAVDDYIIEHINDGGYGITMLMVDAITIEIG